MRIIIIDNHNIQRIPTKMLKSTSNLLEPASSCSNMLLPTNYESDLLQPASICSNLLTAPLKC